MKIFYSASTGGFYFDEIHGDAKPDDCNEIDNELYQSLVGGDVVAGPNGVPMLRPAFVPTAEDKRTALKVAATAKRYEIECGGVVLPNGIRIDTAREDQAAIANTLAVLPCTGLASISFKAASGFITLTFEELTQIAAAVGLHKQACYSAEWAHHEAIDALPDAGLVAYDLGAGWPTGADLASLSTPADA